MGEEVVREEEMLVGRTGIIPVPLEVPVWDIIDVVVVVEVGCSCEIVEVDVGISVDVDTVTIVVRCVDEEKIDTVNI